VSDSPQPVIAIDHVSKNFRHDWTFKKKCIIKDISFTVERGVCFGFVGPNGAGKTTTIKMLLDLIRPSSGAILILGGSPSNQSVRRRIGFLPERPYFYEYLTGLEFLRFYARLSFIPFDEKLLHAMLDRVGLHGAGSVFLKSYSKGMLQRIGLAQALMGDPELIILDEPMSGLDPLGRRHIRDVILDLKQQGKTIFFSSHILPDIEAICDRVAMIHRGQIQLVGAVSELLQRAQKDRVEIVLRASSLLPASLAGFVEHGGLLTGVVTTQEVQDVLACALAQKLEVVSVTPYRGTLEDELLSQIGESK